MTFYPSRFNLTVPLPQDVARRRDMRTLDRVRDLRNLLNTMTESGDLALFDDALDHAEALLAWTRSREGYFSDLWDDVA